MKAVALSGKRIPFSGRVKHFPIKRLFDIVFSLAALVIGSPLFFVIGLLVKLSSPGPLVYGHERVGRGGRIFLCYKFRTMFPDADKRLHHILDADPMLKAEWDATHKLKNDPRVTPIGSFLRRTSLDELPQFWNVLKGDLSIVGPRPVVEVEVTKFLGPKAATILSIRPGLTCLWQIAGRSNTSYDMRVILDEHYVQNRSLAMDMRIIAKTVPALLSSRGAY